MTCYMSCGNTAQSIIERKLMAPEIFDLMDKVADTLIFSQIDIARTACAQVRRISVLRNFGPHFRSS